MQFFWPAFLQKNTLIKTGISLDTHYLSFINFDKINFKVLKVSFRTVLFLKQSEKKINPTSPNCSQNFDENLEIYLVWPTHNGKINIHSKFTWNKDFIVNENLNKIRLKVKML